MGPLWVRIRFPQAASPRTLGPLSDGRTKLPWPDKRLSYNEIFFGPQSIGNRKAETGSLQTGPSSEESANSRSPNQMRQKRITGRGARPVFGLVLAVIASRSACSGCRRSRGQRRPPRILRAGDWVFRVRRRAVPHSRSSLIQQASERGHHKASLRNARWGNVERHPSFHAEDRGGARRSAGPPGAS
jgi:hypothetical protein